MNYLDIIQHFYPEDTPLRRLLILHSECVRDKALQIMEGVGDRFQVLGSKYQVSGFRFQVSGFKEQSIGFKFQESSAVSPQHTSTHLNTPSTHLNSPQLTLNPDLVIAGAMLHDIGICQTHAPGILCEGTDPYICHGTIGAKMLRQLMVEQSFSDEDAAMLAACARICERHTGAGLTREDIIRQKLPLDPSDDLVPETLEEQLVCLADKFFSKSGDPRKEKSLEHVRRSMMKFGADSMARFEALCNTFCIK